MATKTCRQDLPVDIWEKLAVLAEASEQKIGTYTRDILIQHVLEERGETRV